MSDDLIKKEEAKEAVCRGCLKDWEICHHHWDCPMLTNLEMLPSADTELEIIKAKAYVKGIDSERKRISDWCRPRGEWIKDNLGILICSECKRPRRDNRINHIRFCNSCGAKMKGADDE